MVWHKATIIKHTEVSNSQETSCKFIKKKKQKKKKNYYIVMWPLFSALEKVDFSIERCTMEKWICQTAEREGTARSSVESLGGWEYIKCIRCP